jgi:O-antigen/teichoic acid export membrane protein
VSRPPERDSGVRPLRARQGLSAAVISRFLARGLGLLFAVYIARQASESTFASYSYLLVLAAVVSMITESGVSLVASREVAQRSLAVQDAYRAGLPVVAGIGLLTAALVLAFGAVDNGPGTAGFPLLWTGAFIGINVLFNFQAGLLRASGRPWLEAALQMLASLAQIVGGIVVLERGLGLAALMAVLFAKQAALVMIAQTRLPLPWRGRKARDVTRALLRRGLWLSGATTFAGLMLRASYVALGNAGSAGAVATYAVSSRFLEVMVLVGETVGFGLLPAMAQHARDDGLTRYRRPFVAALAVLTLLTPVAVVATPPFISAVFGDRYAAAGMPTQILVAAFPVIVALYLGWYGHVALGRERRILGCAAAGALVAGVGAAGVALHPSPAHAAIAVVAALVILGLLLFVPLLRPERQRLPALPLLARGAVPLTGTLVAGAALSGAAVLLEPHGGIFLPLAGAVAFVLLVAAFERVPHIALAAFVLFLALQPTLKTFVSSSFGPAKDVMVIAATLATGWRLLFDRRPRAPLDAWLVGGVVLLFVLYAINPAGVHDSAWSNAARLTFESFSLLLVGLSVPAAGRTWRWVGGALVAGACGVALWGLAQQGLGVQGLVRLGFEYDNQIRLTGGGQLRSFGTFGDPFNYAAFLVLALAVTCLTLRRTRWVIVPAAILIAGIAASYVRTSAAIVPVLLLLALVYRRQSVTALVLVTAACIAAPAYVVVSHGTPSAAAKTGGGPSALTLNGRTAGWSRALDTPEHAVMGHGVGALGTGLARAQAGKVHRARNAPLQQTAAEHQRLSVDSTYVALIADVGVVGLMLVLALFGRILTLAARAVSQGRSEGWVVIGLVVAMAIDSLTRTSLTSFPVGYIALLVVGCALGAAVEGQEESAAAVRQPAYQGLELARARRKLRTAAL